MDQPAFLDPHCHRQRRGQGRGVGLRNGWARPACRSGMEPRFGEDGRQDHRHLSSYEGRLAWRLGNVSDAGEWYHAGRPWRLFRRAQASSYWAMIIQQESRSPRLDNDSCQYFAVIECPLWVKTIALRTVVRLDIDGCTIRLS